MMASEPTVASSAESGSSVSTPVGFVNGVSASTSPGRIQPLMASAAAPNAIAYSTIRQRGEGTRPVGKSSRIAGSGANVTM